MKITFKNLDKSFMEYGETDKERALRQRIEEDYTDAAIKASNELKKAFDAKAEKIAEGYFGSAFLGLLKETPRYAYIKNMNSAGEHDDGADVEIDIIAHEYWTAWHK